MATKKKKKSEEPTPKQKFIKILIDNRTKITVRSEEALKMWMERYPNAKIIA